MIKKRNTILIFSLLLILCLGISAVSADDSVSADGNSTDVGVDSGSDASNIEEVGVSEGENLQAVAKISFSEFQSKIKSSSKVTLDSDVVYKSGDSVGGIVIGKDVVIDGKGHTIDAKSKTRVFKVATGKKLTLSNVNIVNGRVSGESGGAILNSGNIVLKHCTFTNCVAAGSKGNGGAISGSGSGTISYCNFTECSAGKMGGAANVNKNKFHYCNFVKDTAGFGGAVAGTVYLYNSNFKSCRATNADNYDGGGAGTGEFPVVDSCTFTNCKATKAYGGALRGTVKATNSKFINCAAKQGGAIRGKGDFSGCTFEGCVATTSMGGAIFTEKATINKCNFIECSASKSDAGAVYMGNNVKLTNSKFTKCSAPNGCGGAVQGNGVISKCTFEKNKAKFGGAVSSYSMTVKASTFNSNHASKGGAAYNVKSLTSCKFNKNTASYGGAVFNAQKVVSSSFVDNSAKFGALSYNTVNVVFNKATVTNTVKLVQGLFHNNKHKLTLSNSKIVNKAKFSKYINYNTGTFVYSKNTLKSTYKVKQVAGPRNVQKK